VTLTVCRKSLQARLKKSSLRSDKDKRDKDFKSNSSSFASMKEADLIMQSKVILTELAIL